MRSSIIFNVGLAALAAAAPVEERATNLPGTFQITKFVYGCTSTCDWSFDVTVIGSAANHPAVSTPVHCSGSLTDQDYVACSDISGTQSISAYIGKRNNNLLLQYEVTKPKQGARYDYYGHTHVNAATSGEPQASKFQVKETRATAVA